MKNFKLLFCLLALTSWQLTAQKGSFGGGGAIDDNPTSPCNYETYDLTDPDMSEEDRLCIDLQNVLFKLRNVKPSIGIKPSTTGLIDWVCNQNQQNGALHVPNLGEHPASSIGFRYSTSNGASIFWRGRGIYLYSVKNQSQGLLKDYNQSWTSLPYTHPSHTDGSSQHNHDPYDITKEGMLFWDNGVVCDSDERMVFKYHSQLNNLEARYHFDSKSSSGWNIQYNPNDERVELVIEGEMFDAGTEEGEYSFTYSRGGIDLSDGCPISTNDAGVFRKVIDITSAGVAGAAGVEDGFYVYPHLKIEFNSVIEDGGIEDADFMVMRHVFIRVVGDDCTDVSAAFTNTSVDGDPLYDETSVGYFETTGLDVGCGDYPEMVTYDSTLLPLHDDLFGHALDAQNYGCTGVYDPIIAADMEWLSCGQTIGDYHEPYLVPVPFSISATQKGIAYQPFVQVQETKCDFGLEEFYLQLPSTASFLTTGFNQYTSTNNGAADIVFSNGTEGVWNLGTEGAYYCGSNLINSGASQYGLSYIYAYTSGTLNNVAPPLAEMLKDLQEELAAKQLYHTTYLGGLINGTAAKLAMRLTSGSTILDIYNVNDVFDPFATNVFGDNGLDCEVQDWAVELFYYPDGGVMDDGFPVWSKEFTIQKMLNVALGFGDDCDNIVSDGNTDIPSQNIDGQWTQDANGDWRFWGTAFNQSLNSPTTIYVYYVDPVTGSNVFIDGVYADWSPANFDFVYPYPSGTPLTLAVCHPDWTADPDCYNYNDGTGAGCSGCPNFVVPTLFNGGNGSALKINVGQDRSVLGYKSSRNRVGAHVEEIVEAKSSNTNWALSFHFQETATDNASFINKDNLVGNMPFIARTANDYFNIPIARQEGYNTPLYLHRGFEAPSAYKTDVNGNHIMKMMRGSLDFDYGKNPATNDYIPFNALGVGVNFWHSSYKFYNGCDIENVVLP